MADDIVTRLRDRYPNVVHPHILRDAELVGEAAAEIQRLRTLADNLAYHLQGYVCHCNMSKCKCGYDDVMDEYREVRGG